MNNHPLNRLRHHVTGAIERGEKEAIIAMPAKRQSFSAYWTDKLGQAISQASSEPYPIECHAGSDDLKGGAR